MEKLQTTTYEIGGVSFKMILVEAGTFRMGSDDTRVEFSESPAHNVTLTKDYLIGETEVTQALWNSTATAPFYGSMPSIASNLRNVSCPSRQVSISQPRSFSQLARPR